MCVCPGGGGSACARGCRRSLPVTSSRFCRAEPGESGPAAGIAGSRPASCELWQLPSSPFPGPLTSWLCTLLDSFVPRIAGDLGLVPTPSLPHTSEGPYCRLVAVFRGPSPEESAQTIAFKLAGRSAASPCLLQLQPGSLLGPFPRAGGAAVVPGARPEPPPSEVCLPSLPGWGKCASGRLVAGALEASSASWAWTGCWRHI